MATTLTEEELERYSRQIMLDEIDRAGQAKIRRARVLIVGAGGLGSPAAFYLAAAGVGTIGIVDADRVDLSNLQRQILHSTEDVGSPKVESARRTLSLLNPGSQIRTYQSRFDESNAGELVAGYDFVLDCSDNFATKFLINDVCVGRKLPFCHAGVLRFQGQVMTILPGSSACYRCVFDREPDPQTARARSTAGIIGVVPGLVGTIQAGEALKYITGCGSLLSDTLLSCDLLTMRFRSIPLKRQAHCPVCG